MPSAAVINILERDAFFVASCAAALGRPRPFNGGGAYVGP